MLYLKEWLAEKLQYTELFEMAETRAKAEKTIRGVGKEIIYHLAKVLYWEDALNKQKHLKDIQNWLRDIDDIELKPNNKKPKENDIYEWLWSAPFGNGCEWFHTKIINRRLEDYHELPRTNLSVEELYRELERICKEISRDISTDEFISIENYLKD